MIKKACINVKGNWFISKSHSNMARIGILHDMFPDAKFIFLYRDPYKTVESFFRFFHEVLPAIQLQDENGMLSRERLTRVYADMVRQYRDEKHIIPEENLMEIKFEEFSKDPLKALKGIFTRFGILGLEEAMPHFKHYLEDVSQFRQTKYEVTGETIHYVNDFAGDIVDWLGYPKRT
jgi:hypothetical protein